MEMDNTAHLMVKVVYDSQYIKSSEKLRNFLDSCLSQVPVGLIDYRVDVHQFAVHGEIVAYLEREGITKDNIERSWVEGIESDDPLYVFRVRKGGTLWTYKVNKDGDIEIIPGWGDEENDQVGG